MGFWSTLGKIGKFGADIGASLIPGGSLGKAALKTAIGAGGQVIGGMADAASKNRGEQDRLNINRDQLRLQGIQQAENAAEQRALLEMKQREEQRVAQDQAYKNALRSALAKNTQDASFDTSGFHSNVPRISFSGGARPSALGPEGREAASILNNQAMQTLMAPPALTTLPAQERFQRSEPSKASIWEKLAGPLGLGLTAVGAGLDEKNKGVPAYASDAPPLEVPQPQASPLTPNQSIFRNVRF